MQASPVWAALIDDAEQRGTVVHNASAAELFPNMTELHLMQANRRTATPEPHPPAVDGVPQGEFGHPSTVQGVNDRGRGGPQGGRRGRGPWRGGREMDGVRGGPQGQRGGRDGISESRRGPEPTQGGHHGGHMEANAGQAIAHGVVDNAQHALPQTSGQAMLQSDSYPDPRVAAAQPDLRKSQLTSAQLAIQQGKLQQQLERQQQQPQLHSSQQQQPTQAHMHPLPQQQEPQHQQSQQQQQQWQPQQQRWQQQQQQEVGRGPGHQVPATAPHVQAQQAMQGFQHAHWDHAYSGTGPRDPRQAPARTLPDSQNQPAASRADQSQSPSWLRSHYPTDTRPGPDGSDYTHSAAAQAGSSFPLSSHQAGASQLSEHHHSAAGKAASGGMAPQPDLQLRRVGASHAGQSSMSEMPTIPSRIGSHAPGSHAPDGQEQRPAQHVTQRDAHASKYVSIGQGPVDVETLPRQAGRQVGPGPPLHAGPPTDHWKLRQTRSDESAAPHVPQLASPTYLGRNGLQHSAEAPQVPLWTNNRR